MKIYSTILLGFILSVVALYSVSDYYENGDTDASLMYLVVYILPFMVLSVLNGIALRLVENRKKHDKLFIALLLPVISVILLFSNDASLYFVGLVALIVFGIINFIWLARYLDEPPSNY